MKELVHELAPSALSRELLRHESFVRALAHKLTRDEHEAEDVVQDAWVTTLRKRPDVRIRGLRPWLSKVVQRAALTRRRSNSRREAREARAARGAGELQEVDAGHMVRSLETQQMVVESVLALEEPYRSTILLRYYEELPLREIAEREKLPVETVRTRLRRGHEQLRRNLDRRNGDRSIWLAALTALEGGSWPGRGVATASLISGGVVVGTLAVIGTFVASTSKAPGQEDGPGPLAEGPPIMLAEAGPPPSVDEDVLELPSERAPVGTVSMSAQITSTGTDSRAEFWRAVRSARERRGLVERTLEEAPSVRRRLEETEIRAFFAPEAEECEQRAERVLALALTEGQFEAPEYGKAPWRRAPIDLGYPHSVAEILSLILRDARPDLWWTAGEEDVRIGPRAELHHARSFELHFIEDLLIDPAEFFEAGEDIAPLFGVLDMEELLERMPALLSLDGTLRIVEERDSVLRFLERAELRGAIPRGALLGELSQGAHRRVRLFLEVLRSFYLPDPEEGVPGWQPAQFLLQPGSDVLYHELSKVRRELNFSGWSYVQIARELELATEIDFVPAWKYHHFEWQFKSRFRPKEARTVLQVLYALEDENDSFYWFPYDGMVRFVDGASLWSVEEVRSRYELRLYDVRDLLANWKQVRTKLPKNYRFKKLAREKGERAETREFRSYLSSALASERVALKELALPWPELSIGKDGVLRSVQTKRQQARLGALLEHLKERSTRGVEVLSGG